MTRFIILAAAGLTLSACSDIHNLGVTDGCNGESSPLLEGQTEPVRCGPQFQSPSGTGTDIAVPGDAS